MNASRKIIHCDCDCFYAAIETRDNPGLNDLPLAVGGAPERRGVVATCNYAARKFGIHSAMASATARKLCPDLIIIKPRMEKYRAASLQIHEIFRQFTDQIEPLSLDEAFLDVSGAEHCNQSATLMAAEIRQRVRQQIGITISAGIAPNKFLAKIASDWNKPDGQFVITPEQVDHFVLQLPVNKLFGVGKVTYRKMQKLGIYTCQDLRQLGGEKLTELFGSFGKRLHDLSRGIDDRPVQTSRIRKSLSVENTYAIDLPDLETCLTQLPELWSRLLLRLEKTSGKYLISKQFIKMKFLDFQTTTVETGSCNTEIANFQQLCEQGYSRGNRPVRLLGLGVRLTPLEDLQHSATGQQQLDLLQDLADQ